MTRRRKPKPRGEGVELNLAAMLDMAFQLLTFFILTFHPAPEEIPIKLRMPEAMPTATQSGVGKPGIETQANPMVGLRSLLITATYGADGGSQLFVGNQPVSSMVALDARLKSVLGETNSPFDQVLIQADSRLRYQDLLDVVDVCTRQKLANGDKLSKLSFVELPGGR